MQIENAPTGIVNGWQEHLVTLIGMHAVFCSFATRLDHNSQEKRSSAIR